MQTTHKFAIGMTVTTAVMAIVASIAIWPLGLLAAEPAATAIELPAGIWEWGLLAAALSTGLAALGAGYAVGNVGVAAIGLLAEKPELFGRAIIMVGLAEGIAIYGLIISILILNRLV